MPVAIILLARRSTGRTHKSADMFLDLLRITRAFSFFPIWSVIVRNSGSKSSEATLAETSAWSVSTWHRVADALRMTC